MEEVRGIPIPARAAGGRIIALRRELIIAMSGELT